MPLQPSDGFEQRFFIGPHPLNQWKQRINPLLDAPLESDDDIRVAIETSLQRPHLPMDVEGRDGEREALLYKCQFGRVACTVVVVHGTKGPAVATVIPDTEQLDRRAIWNKEPWRGSRALRKLRVMRSFDFSPKECAAVLSKPIGVIEEHWDEADPSRKCGTCVYFGKAMSECMKHDGPVKRNQAPCGDYRPDAWEVQKEMPPKKEFTPEQVSQAVTMWNDGKSAEEITKAIGLAKSALYRRVKTDWSHLVDTEARERAQRMIRQSEGQGKRQDDPRQTLSKDQNGPDPEPTTVQEKPAPKVAPKADVAPEPVCETCIHNPVCRYQDTYLEHQEWALCKWWKAKEGAA